MTTQTRTLGPYVPPASKQYPGVDAAVRTVCLKYNLDRWFVNAVVNTESSFNPKGINKSDPLPPKGYRGTKYQGTGLTQLTGTIHHGMTLPCDLTEPNEDDPNWKRNVGIDWLPTTDQGWPEGTPRYGKWTLMKNVTPVFDDTDPLQNLERWITVHVVPYYALVQKMYGLTDKTEILRVVALGWKTGTFRKFNPSHDYLIGEWGYDRWVRLYKPICEAEDTPVLTAPAYPALVTPPPAPEPVFLTAQEVDDRIAAALRNFDQTVLEDKYALTVHDHDFGGTTGPAKS